MIFFPKKVSSIVLDRDGVINIETGCYVKSIEEWQPIESSLKAIGELYQAGLKVFVATNQSGIAQGLYDCSMLEAIHEKMHAAIQDYGGKVEAIVYCPHVDSDGCDCRKPKPGLLHQLVEKHGVELDNAVMVGDSVRDIEASLAAGCYPVLVKSGHASVDMLVDRLGGLAEQIPVYNDLAAFVAYFLENKSFSDQ